MDQNRDGFIDKEDLKDTYASLGRCPGAQLCHDLAGTRSGPTA